jgi:Holliday junction DNA helicase RuvA
MIVRLRGEIVEKSSAGVVLDVNGVGYGVVVTAEDFGTLAVGQPAALHIYEHVRETAYDLFGFVHEATKILFNLLLNVNGVGPKMAVSILSIGSADDVRAAIATGDTKYIQAAQGVGKRVAERVIVDLKDKVGLGANDEATAFLSTPGIMGGDEALLALVSLGYSVQDAGAKLQGIDPSLPLEDRVKLALQRR